MKQKLIIRTNASPWIGTGHLMRCLALAQGWKARGGPVTFITECESDSLRQHLSDEGFQVIALERSYPDPADWAMTSQTLAVNSDTWVVLDGYQFDPTYQCQIRDAGHRLLVIDDMAHLNHYYADIVLNQNLHAEQLHYSCEPCTRLLLGTRYVLLRREFLEWRKWKRTIPEVARKVLVTLGGADTDNVALKVINALKKVDISELNIKIVVGPSNPHIETLQKALSSSLCSMCVVQAVENMPALMAWADLAIAGGGATSWELAFMGSPNIIIVLAENQTTLADKLEELGAAINLGWHHELSTSSITETVSQALLAEETRAKMSRRGQKLVDGYGITRVLMHMIGKILRLRRVRKDDLRLLWEWANERDVRASAFSSGPINWEEHNRWFIEKLNNPNCSQFIALDERDIPIGQARFDVQGEEAEIDVSIGNKKRGFGYGSYLIRIAVEKMFFTTSVKVAHAYVKPTNKPSIYAFRKAGFQVSGLDVVRGYNAVHLIKVKNADNKAGRKT